MFKIHCGVFEWRGTMENNYLTLFFSKPTIAVNVVIPHCQRSSDGWWYEKKHTIYTHYPAQSDLLLIQDYLIIIINFIDNALVPVLKTNSKHSTASHIRLMIHT